MKKKYHFIYILFLLLYSQSLQAVDFRTGENMSIDTTLNSDSYIACKNLSLNSPVRGDLIAAAQTIIINDTVSGDLTLAAETITVAGYVGDDLRVFGRTVTLKGIIKGHVILFSGDAVLHKGTIIEGDLIVYSGNITNEGLIKGNVIIKGGEVMLNGSIEGGVDARAGKLRTNGHITGPSTLAAKEIEFGQNANFTGKVNYWQQAGATNTDAGKFKGGITFDPSLAFAKEEYENKGLFAGIGFLAWHFLFGALLILLLTLLIPTILARSGIVLRSDTLKSFGIGILYFISVPFIVVFLFIILIGIPIGMLLLFVYIFTLISGLVIASLVTAYYIRNRYNKNWNKWTVAGVSLLVLLILQIILLIPVIGFLFSIFLVAAAYGALLMNIKKKPATTA